MLQGPVPIVVVIFTKVFCTANDFLPGRLVERHSHIVFAADPWCYLDLQEVQFKICLWSMFLVRSCISWFLYHFTFCKIQEIRTNSCSVTRCISKLIQTKQQDAKLCTYLQTKTLLWYNWNEMHNEGKPSYLLWMLIQRW